MAETLITTQVGGREDLADLIHVADASSTPMTTMTPKGKELINPLFQWQVDDYDPPKNEGVLSNADVTDFEDKAKNRQKLSGRIQKFRRSFKVDDLAENVSDVAGLGRKKEIARAVTKSIEEIKRDIESAFCSDNDSQEQSGNTPYKTRGLGAWAQNSAQADSAVPEAYRTPADSIDTTAMASLTDTIIQNLLQSRYLKTGRRERLIGLFGPTLKRAFTDLTKLQTGVSSTVAALRVFSQDADDKKIVATIDFYAGDFGEIEIHPTLYAGKFTSTAANLRRGYIFAPEDLEIRYNRMPQFKQLADEGGGPRGYVDAIAALLAKNPLVLIKLAATT